MVGSLEKGSFVVERSFAQYRYSRVKTLVHLSKKAVVDATWFHI